MGEGWNVADRWWGDRAVDSGGGCTLTLVRVVAIVLCDMLGCVVGVVHCWARDVAGETADGVVVCATGLAAGFELLAAETAG